MACSSQRKRVAPLNLRIGRRGLLTAAILLAALSAPIRSQSPIASLLTPGTTEGQFTVTPDGTASYSIPLRVSPGTGGLEPKLYLAYSHRGVAGPAGFGWVISGLSDIQRGPRNVADDGQVAGVSFDAADAFQLDGERLVRVAALPGGTVEFRTRTESYSRIRAYEWTREGPGRFVVETRAGLLMHYGTQVSSRVRLSIGPVLKWLCDRIEDRLGNYITFTYATTGLDYRISRVDYTGNQAAGLLPYASVSFDYDTVPAYDLSYVAGERISSTAQLRAITSRFGTEILRRYELAHSAPNPTHPAFHLMEVSESGADGLTFKPLKFSYSAPAPDWREQEKLTLPVDLSQISGMQEGFKLIDVNGDGTADLLFRAHIGGQIKKGAYLSIGNRWVAHPEWEPPVEFSDERGANRGLAVADVNGDGREDLVLSAGRPDDGVYLNAGPGWRYVAQVPGTRFSRDGNAETRYLFIDVDPGNRNGEELIWSSPRGSGAMRFRPTGWVDLPSLVPPLPFNTDANGALVSPLAVDVDCDGALDLAYLTAVAAGTRSEAYRATGGAWVRQTSQFSLPFSALPDAAAARSIDLDADGCRDMVVAYRASGATVRAAYLASAAGWRVDPRSLPDVLLWTDSAGRLTEVADLNGDGRADVFWNDEGAATKGAYLGRLAGWQETPSLSPPLPLPTGPARNARFRVVPMGSGGPRLFYTRPAGEDETIKVYRTTPQSTWIADTNYTLPVDVAQFDKVDTGVRFLDLNADGYLDLVYARKRTDGVVERQSYVFTPGAEPPWVLDERFALPVAISADDLKDLGASLVDVTGDGLTDILLAFRKNPTQSPDLVTYENCSRKLACRSATGPSAFWRPIAGFAPPEPFADMDHGSLGARQADLNGDGLTDIILSRIDRSPTENWQLRSQVYLNRGSTWEPYPALAAPVEFNTPWFQSLDGEPPPFSNVRDHGVQLVDVNGDRLPDLIYHFETLGYAELGTVKVPDGTKTIKRGALLNRGDRWEEAESYIPPQRLDGDTTRPSRQYYLEDLNGDGLADLVYAEKDGNSVSYLNSGRGWVPEPAYNVPASAVFTSGSDQGFRFMDVNADGLPDVVYRWKAGDVETSGVSLNTGLGWSIGDLGFAPPSTFMEEGRGDLGVRPLDLNGDAIADLIQSYTSQVNERRQTVFLNLAPKPDLLSTIENGLGVVTAITYQSVLALSNDSLASSGTYEPASESVDYPVLDAPMPGYVATRVSVVGPGVLPRSSTYRYGGYRVDSRSGRPLGFAFQEARDETRGRITQVKYLQTEGLVGTASDTRVIQEDAQGRVISEANHQWIVDTSSGEPLPSGFRPLIHRASLKRLASRSWDLTGALIGEQTDAFDYDGMGNAVLTRTEFGDGSGSETRNEYEDDPGRWLLARLTRSTVTLFAVGSRSQIRVGTFEYDRTTGQLTREVALAGTPYEVVTSYDHDIFGNRRAVETTTSEPDSARRVEAFFDPRGRFQRGSRNSLNHESAVEYDDVSGMPVVKVDPNGVRTMVAYDALQRTVLVTAPTGASTGTEYKFADLGVPGIAYSIVRVTSGLPPGEDFYDGSGRVRLSRSIGAGGRVVEIAQDYDALGRSVRRSLPHFGGDRAFFVQRDYDALDRTVVESDAHGSVTRTAYSGFITTITDPLGRQTTLVDDQRGRRRYTEDAIGGRTAFQYDVAGRRTATVDALGHVSRTEYDPAGCNILHSDPAGGTWRYTCDAYGQITSQTSPMGLKTLMRYDKLGRVTARSTSGGVDRWTYGDQTAHAIGRVVRTDAAGGLTRQFFYDDVGRLAVTRTRFGADRVEVSQSYDQLDRPIRRDYSTGVSVRNTFDGLGLWRKVNVEDERNVTLAWEGTSWDAAGRVVGERLGNGVISSRIREPETGRLTALQSLSGSVNVQDVTLRYDTVGNLIERDDHADSGIHRFAYDALNRLTLEGTKAGDVTIRYDALGNILRKSDVGTYHACDVAPARLCEVVDDKGSSSTLEYDAAGNVIRIGLIRLDLDLNGRVSRVRQSARNYSRFQYSEDGDLIRNETRHGVDKFDSVNLGDVEILREEFAPPLLPTPERTRVRLFLQSPVGPLGVHEQTFWHFPIRYDAPAYEAIAFPRPHRSTVMTRSVSYFVTDHLGSLRVVTDESGGIIDRLRYDAWGRRQGDSSAYVYRTTKRGFTGHEHLDNVGLVHMGGRIYSPSLARFLEADPLLQAPDFSQSYNRYAYVLNNPLRLIDPDGLGFFDFIGDIFSGIVNAVVDVFDAVFVKPIRWVGEQLAKVGRWIGQNWKTIVVVAASIALTAIGVPPVFAGAFLGGAGAALNGGSLEDILSGALIGGVTAGMFGGVGDMHLSGVVASTAHGVVGGVSSGLQGGDFGRGFLSAFVTRGVAPGIEQLPDMGYRVAAAAVTGGVVSEIGGGSFENGAVTGTFSRLFNDEGHRDRGRTRLADDRSPAGGMADKLWGHYAAGSGEDFILTDSEFESLSTSEHSVRQVPNRVDTALVQFPYASDNGLAFGTATITTGTGGRWTSFRDYYNFDPHPWGDRSIPAEVITRAVNYGSPSSYRPFKVCYPQCPSGWNPR